MIIKYPTGFYKSILPKTDDDIISVTYTISTQDPPRTSLIYPKIPRGLTVGQIYINMNLEAERANLGELLYTTTSSSRSETQSGNKQFVIGQNLSFSNVVEQIIDPMLVPEIVEFQHDQSNVDYERIGLNQDDIQTITNATDETLNILTASLNIKRQLRANAERQISDYQRDIANIERTIRALEATLVYVDVTEILAKLITKRDALQAKMVLSITDANKYAAECESIAANLHTIAMVAR